MDSKKSLTGACESETSSQYTYEGMRAEDKKVCHSEKGINEKQIQVNDSLHIDTCQTQMEQRKSLRERKKRKSPRLRRFSQDFTQKRFSTDSKTSGYDQRSYDNIYQSLIQDPLTGELRRKTGLAQELQLVREATRSKNFIYSRTCLDLFTGEGTNYLLFILPFPERWKKREKKRSRLCRLL
mmetsp:Transcript_23172/g.34712  ORF Transcript_23172/g.34712 Transcript_23172/m.34712 type:complete len:182 (-) Transcript_23172:72-617(-)